MLLITVNCLFSYITSISKPCHMAINGNNCLLLVLSFDHDYYLNKSHVSSVVQMLNFKIPIVLAQAIHFKNEYDQKKPGC